MFKKKCQTILKIWKPKSNKLSIIHRYVRRMHGSICGCSPSGLFTHSRLFVRPYREGVLLWACQWVSGTGAPPPPPKVVTKPGLMPAQCTGSFNIYPFLLRQLHNCTNGLHVSLLTPPISPYVYYFRIFNISASSSRSIFNLPAAAIKTVNWNSFYAHTISNSCEHEIQTKKQIDYLH